MIAFRCDASPVIGLGHLMRCRTLAYALCQLGEKCTMMGPELSYRTQMDERVFAQWTPMPEGNKEAQQDAAVFIQLSQSVGASFAVLDSYRVNESYQQTIYSSGLKWLQFDGRAQQPFWANIITNINLQVQAEDYQPLLQNKKAVLLLGADYSILRPEFITTRKSDGSRRCQRILVSFGGGGDLGAIQFVLKALLSVHGQDTYFVVISGERNPANKALKNWVALFARERVALHINPENIAALMAGCDLAIIGGGGTSYEAACLGMPMVIIAIVDNQVMQAKAWEKSGAAIFLGSLHELSEQQLQSTFVRLLENDAQRQAMAVRASRLVDGQGVRRVAESIQAFIKNAG